MRTNLRRTVWVALAVLAFTFVAWGQFGPAVGVGGPAGPAAAAPAAAPGPGALPAPAPGPGAMAAPGAMPAPAPGAMPAAVQGLAAAQPPAPVPASLDEAWGIATVGDLPGFVDGLGLVTGQFQPTMNGMVLKGMLGGVLGDPTFEGYPAGSGAVVVAFPPRQLVGFLEIVPAKADACVAALRKMPNTVAEKVGDLVVVGDNDASLASGRQFAAEVKKRYLAGAGKPVLKVSLFPDRGLPIAEPKILGFVKMMAAMPQMQNPGGGANVGVAAPNAPAAPNPMRILEGEARIFLSLAHQTQTFDLTVIPAGGGVRFEMAGEAKPDSALGKLYAAPIPPVADVMKLVPAQGAVRGAVAYDTGALVVFLRSELDQLAGDMALTAEEKDAFQEYLDVILGLGNSAMAFDMLVPGGSLMSGSAVYQVADPAKAIATLKESPQKMQGFLKMYEKMGMKSTTTFQENARQVKGVAVHRITLTMDVGAQADPAQRAMMDSMFGQGLAYEVATVDKTVVLAFGGQSIDSLVEAALAKSNPAAQPFAALTVFGPTAKAYGDLNVAGLAQTFGSVFAAVVSAAGVPPNGNPEAKMKEVADALQGASPVTMVLFADAAMSRRSCLDIPADVIAKVGGLVAKGRASRASGPEEKALEDTFSKIARAQADMRSLSVALESFNIDWDKYPPSSADPAQNLFGAAAAERHPALKQVSTFRWMTRKDMGMGGQPAAPNVGIAAPAGEPLLMPLTTPIAYVGRMPADPFAAGAPEEKTPFCYYSSADRKFLLWSAGPDGQYDVTTEDLALIFGPSTPDPRQALTTGAGASGRAFTFDASNGTTSAGDVWHLGPRAPVVPVVPAGGPTVGLPGGAR